MANKKILHIVEAMGGGVFTYIVDLTNALVSEYDVYIAYAVREQTPQNYKTYFDKRIHLIEVKNFERSINLAKDIKAFFEMRSIANKIGPDIIHLHSSKAGALGRWAFNGHKIPLFYTPHGYSFLMKNHCPVKRFFYKTIEIISSKRYCTTVSCSKGEHQETLKLTKDAAYVNNGINVNELQKLINTVEVQKDQSFTVFTLGRICSQKNPVLFNQIAETYPDIKFVWIGDGELRDKLASPNIEITGWVERKEALKRSLEGTVFLLTSLWEGLPMSLLEAMYLRKICIVNNVIGNRDVIQNNMNGFLCNGKKEFIKAIDAARNRNIRNLIEEAHSDILKKFNTTAMANEYRKLYERVLNE